MMLSSDDDVKSLIESGNGAESADVAGLDNDTASAAERGLKFCGWSSPVEANRLGIKVMELIAAGERLEVEDHCVGNGMK